MAKATKKISLRKTKKKTVKGVIHIQATFNNTIITITDVRGQVVAWSSAGSSGFKAAKKNTPFAAQVAAENAIRVLIDQGMKQAEVMLSGPGRGRDTALRAIIDSGIQFNFVRDVTPMPHNGCRSPKKRRV